MPSRTLAKSFLALAVLLATLPVLAGTVYQWKDAKGVTHYSDAPPPDRKGVQNRELKDDAPAAAAQAAKSPAKPTDENANCALLRNNLTQLQSDQPVGVDANGDGQMDSAMTDAERTEQIHQAELSLKTYCDKPGKR
ncbi:DUF4124 domain-containing protein [Lysobacter terrae]